MKKSLSCISLPRQETRSSPNHRHQDSYDSYKDGTQVDVREHKGTKMQTMIEVLKCEFAKPGRTAPTIGGYGIEPSKRWTPLHYAAYHNREGALLHFLRTGQSPDGAEGVAESPLLVAVAGGHIGIVRILCAAGANVNASTEQKGETALHLAINSGRTDILDVLLCHGPEIEARTAEDRETPLHYAAAKIGSLAAVVALLKREANVEALDSKGRTPAAAAIANSNINAAVAIVSAVRGDRKKLAKEKEMLLRHVEKVQNRFSMNNDLIADIFEAGRDPGSTVLIEAIKRDDVGLAEMFLGKGADPNRPTAQGLRPIFAALECSGAQMVRLLAKYDVDASVTDAEGLTVLQAALESPSAYDREAIHGIFEALLPCGADPKVTYADGKTLLHHVVSSPINHPRIAQRLLECGVKVNQIDKSGSSALHYASQSKSCVEVLLKHRADTALTNYDGLTPFLSAVATASSDGEPDLESLAKASDIRIITYEQRTALHIAAERGLTKTIRLLLKHRAETTAVDSKGRTPLLLAVLAHQFHVVPLLAIQPGINSWDETGMTALHYLVTSMPTPPASWNDIASATAKFCERGVSRTMRNRKGQTPLIAAAMVLPEEGLPVIEALLTERGPIRSNCIGHEDHKQRSALFYAGTLEKPAFVQALLKHGAPFALRDWTLAKGPVQPTTPANKKTLKLLAEHDWVRRMRQVHRTSGSTSPTSVLPSVLPLEDLDELLSLGLDPNALPTGAKHNVRASLLWTILNQSLRQPSLPPQYLHDTLRLILEHKANPNALTIPKSSIPLASPSPQQPIRHPITFLLEEHPGVDIEVINLLLSHNASLTTASPVYGNRHPLHSAVRPNRLDIVDAMLTCKTDPDPCDEKKQTPLFLAAHHGFEDIADLLLRNGANVNAKDSEENTPLHVATAAGNAGIISILLKSGARVSIVNGKGQTPMACVSEDLDEKEKGRISKLLRAAAQKETSEEEDRKRMEEQRKKRLEQQAVQEGKERLRKEREYAAKVSAAMKAQHDLELKQQQQREKEKSPNSAPIPPPSSAKPSAPPTPKSKPKSKPKTKAHISFFSRIKHTAPAPSSISSSAPPVLPPIPLPQAPSASTTSVHKTPTPISTTQKSPRIDSGIGHISGSVVDLDKPLPVLDRSKKGFEEKKGNADREQGAEFDDWLAMSRILDRL